MRGGALGKHVQAVIETHQGNLVLTHHQKAEFLRILNNTYTQANASFDKLSSAMIELRDYMSSLASKVPATVTEVEMINTYKGQLENVIGTHIKQCADQHKRLNAFHDMLNTFAATYGILPAMYITLGLGEPTSAPTATPPTSKGPFTTKLLVCPPLSNGELVPQK